MSITTPKRWNIGIQQDFLPISNKHEIYRHQQTVKTLGHLKIKTVEVIKWARLTN